MPPKKSSAQLPNYLLKITLCKTTNPTVTRLLSIPADLHFSELHNAIAAAFGWDTEPCRFWIFRSWKEDPAKNCDSLKFRGSVVVYSTPSDGGSGLKPTSLKTGSRVSDKMKKDGPGRYWAYEYDMSRLHHAIEVVDSIDDDQQRGKLACLGGQGQIGRQAWQFADLAGAEGVVVAGKSAWDLDMQALNKRLAIVQEWVEKRREGEREKAVVKKTGAKEKQGKDTGQKVAKGTAPVPTPPKSISPKSAPEKPKNTAAAKPGPGKAVIPQNATAAKIQPKKRTSATKDDPKPAKKAKIVKGESDEEIKEIGAFKVERR